MYMYMHMYTGVLVYAHDTRSPSAETQAPVSPGLCVHVPLAATGTHLHPTDVDPQRVHFVQRVCVLETNVPEVALHLHQLGVEAVQGAGEGGHLGLEGLYVAQRVVQEVQAAVECRHLAHEYNYA